MQTRRLRLSGPLHLGLTLAPLRHGPADPTIRLSRSEAWRATRTPNGPATVRLAVRDGEVVAQAWGPGAAWTLDHLPDLLGATDEPESFRPRDPTLAALHRRLLGLRLGRSGAVVEALVPTILEQKVVTKEAHRTYSALCRALGGRAPGPGDMRLPPDPARLAEAPYWSLHRFGVERKRAEVISRVCALRGRLEVIGSDPARATTELVKIRGIGPWTAAEVAAVAAGDLDAVRLNDFHLPKMVAWTLAGESDADDRRMLELLEPYRDQRTRVVRIIELAGHRAPRRAPRRRLRSIAAI